MTIMSMSSITMSNKIREQKGNSHRENTRREESKYLKCENRLLGLSAIAKIIW